MNQQKGNELLEDRSESNSWHVMYIIL